jgi:D-alanyl-D-alanine carboxypeptidase (penicillin-binding protein 5/6)
VGYVATDTPTMRELLRATLVYSGNDAASNAGINVAGSEAAFVERMNQKAQELGLTHTHFANPHGLEAEGHYASVADLVVMGRYAMEHYPFIAETVHLRGVEATVNGYDVWLESTDDLMETYEGLLGIKTGMVEAGATFLGASQRGTVTLYTAVLGCDTGEGRFADTARLMDWAYDSFTRRTFGRSGWVLRTCPYALGFGARCLVTLPEDQVATTWPDGGSITYRSITAVPDAMMEPEDAFSAIWWRQDGRLAGASTTQVGSLVTDVPSMNPLALPLFLQKDAS